MYKDEHKELIEMAKTEPWLVRKRLNDYLATVTPEDRPSGSRTDEQHRALFLWFDMIEKEAENAGITFDMVIRHTHQLRITKEGLHDLFKQLQKALWGKKSTKDLKKLKQLDIIIDHFCDLFGKEGLELPPFPHRDQLKE